MTLSEAAYQDVGCSTITGNQVIDFTDNRWLFYQFCRQQGLCLKEIIGQDLLTEPEVLN